MRMDVPLGVIRPEHDQMPSACKNWLTAGRWADVSNADFGVTWVTLDAPLVQVGGLTANLLNSQTNPDVWRKQIEPTQKLYSWAMNNHWGTNYRAYQEGPVAFRFVLRPHAARQRCGPLALCHRLQPAAGRRAGPRAATRSTPLLRVAARSSRHRPEAQRRRPGGYRAAVGGQRQAERGEIDLVVAGTRAACWTSDTSELPRQEITGPVPVPAWGVQTLRADLPQ